MNKILKNSKPKIQSKILTIDFIRTKGKVSIPLIIKNNVLN